MWKFAERSLKPKLSIVIPTLNEERYLPKLLTCLRYQTFRDFEVIVADAGSVDNTPAIALQHGCSLVQGGRVAEGRNAGAKKAQGAILCFMDSDALIEARFFENAIADFEERALEIAGCTLVPITNSNIARFFYGGYNTYMKIAGHFGIERAIGSCIFVTRRLFDKAGGFDTTVQYAEDHAFAVECGKHGTFGYLRNCTHYTSTRRLMKEGLLSLIFKSLFCDLHLLTVGPIRHKLISYDMNGYKAEHHEDSFPCDYEFFRMHIFKSERE